MAPAKQSATKRKHTADGTHTTSAKRIKSSYASVLKVVVGRSEAEFLVHEDIICASSDFFKAACSKTWRENQEKTVKLPKSKAEDFQIYLDWVYHGDVNSERAQQYDELGCDENEHFPSEVEAGTAKLFHNLCKLWILSDYLQYELCKTEVMRILLKQSLVDGFSIADGTLQIVCSEVPHDSGLFHWLVDYYSTGYFSEAVDGFPRQFQLALLKKFSGVIDLGEWPITPDIRDLDSYIRKA